MSTYEEMKEQEKQRAGRWPTVDAWFYIDDDITPPITARLRGPSGDDSDYEVAADSLAGLVHKITDGLTREVDGYVDHIEYRSPWLHVTVSTGDEWVTRAIGARVNE